MVRSVTSFGRSGLSDWLVQRVSGVILLAYFLCIGAAKAGTDWLFEQLSAHPDCHFRSIKELHYFDALEQGKLERELEKHRVQQEALRACVRTSRREPQRPSRIRCRPSPVRPETT